MPTSSSETSKQQETEINKEKLPYTSPTLTIIGMQEVATKPLGISEAICGCGPFS